MTSAETIARALGGRKAGSGWMARCPAHDDREPSLSIRDGDGKVLVHCHAGCGQLEVIAALEMRGVWRGRGDSPHCSAPSRDGNSTQPEQQQASRSAAALSIWQAAHPAGGTAVEVYLAARGISLPVPSSLRFHHGLKHPAGGVWPAMVALVAQGTGCAPLAVHRTFLARDGVGKAPVDPPKMMFGPCSGGAVRLGDPDGMLMVGEGIETCLAVMQATGLPAWAALSTSGLRALNLPGTVQEVTILADGDDPGEAAARDAAQRWTRQARRVRIARPPRGSDFNDLLLGGTSCFEGGV